MSDAAEILALVDARPATLGAGRLLCIDGRAGSGKSTLAAAIADLRPATVVHTDDLCPGWDGLPQVPALLAALVEPLAAGNPGSYPRYDWIGATLAEDVVVAPSDLLIIEGVGAGARQLRPWRSALIWLEGDGGTRRSRALERDGESFAPYWDTWADAERAYLASAADRGLADLVLRADPE